MLEKYERCTEWEKIRQDMLWNCDLLERCTEWEKIKQEIYWM